MLYSPNTHRMHAEHKEIYNSEIWVFDWDGVPIQKISVDTQIECFCIDAVNATFYCVMAAPDYSIGAVSIVGN